MDKHDSTETLIQSNEGGWLKRYSPQQVKAAYLVFVSTLGALGTLTGIFLLGLIPRTLFDLSLSVQEIDLANTYSADAYPLRFAILFFLVFLPVLLILFSLDRINIYFVPKDYEYTQAFLERLLWVSSGSVCMFIMTWGYMGIFQESTLALDTIRRLALLSVTFFNTCSPFDVAIVGAVLWVEGQQLPRWLCSLLILGGILSFIINVFSINYTLPFTAYGLTYISYLSPLIVMAAYVVIHERTARSLQTLSD